MAKTYEGLTFGVSAGQHDQTWDKIRDWALWSDEAGLDVLYLFDHFSSLRGDQEGPCLEASTLLAGLAVETERIQLGALVYGNTHRHPAVFAKEMVTIDHLSDGRAVLGIGTGWNEDEHRGYGIPLAGPGTRVAMLDEALTVIRGLFDNRRFSFDGTYYQIDDAPFEPKPVHGHMPILVGGSKPKMLRVVAKHADLWDGGGKLDGRKERTDELKRACDEVGRDYNEIVQTYQLGADTFHDPVEVEEQIRTYADAGVRQFMFSPARNAEQQGYMRTLMNEVVPRLREG